jgi:uncharacterized glyoxalase superfamily protein PhnB
MAEHERTVSLTELVPLLFVDDIRQSAAFYCERLGFEMSEKWEPEGRLAWCCLRRGGAAVMLQQGDQDEGPTEGRGRGVGFFFVCDDADALYEELRMSGLTLEPPKMAFYGMNQLYLKDPDGYELCFQNPTSRD